MTGWNKRAVLRGTISLGGIGQGAYSAVRLGTAQDVRHAPCDSPTVTAGEDVPSLAALAARQERWCGCSVKDSLFTDAPFQELVIRQCSILVCTYSMKWSPEPSAMLCYNSNLVSYGRPGDREHFEGVVAPVERLKSRDVPVHGLGLQGHLAAALDDQFDEQILVWFFEQATSLGLEVMITELDVTDKWMPLAVALRDERVAFTYRRFLDVALAFPAVKGVLTWGLSDRYTALNRWPRDDGWAVRGLPYSTACSPSSRARRSRTHSSRTLPSAPEGSLHMEGISSRLTAR